LRDETAKERRKGRKERKKRESRREREGKTREGGYSVFVVERDKDIVAGFSGL